MTEYDLEFVESLGDLLANTLHQRKEVLEYGVGEHGEHLYQEMHPIVQYETTC